MPKGRAAGQRRGAFQGRRRMLLRNRLTGWLLIGAALGLAAARRG